MLCLIITQSAHFSFKYHIWLYVLFCYRAQKLLYLLYLPTVWLILPLNPPISVQQVLTNMEKLNLTPSDCSIYCKSLCQEPYRTSSVVLPFLFKSVLPMARDARSYFALWETFSLVTAASFLPSSKKPVPIPSLQSNMCTGPFLASSSPNYPGAMRHVRMYSSWCCQAGFQPVLFNWSSL